MLLYSGCWLNLAQDKRCKGSGLFIYLFPCTRFNEQIASTIDRAFRRHIPAIVHCIPQPGCPTHKHTHTHSKNIPIHCSDWQATLSSNSVLVGVRKLESQNMIYRLEEERRGGTPQDRAVFNPGQIMCLEEQHFSSTALETDSGDNLASAHQNMIIVFFFSIHRFSCLKPLLLCFNLFPFKTMYIQSRQSVLVIKEIIKDGWRCATASTLIKKRCRRFISHLCLLKCIVKTNRIVQARTINVYIKKESSGGCSLWHGLSPHWPPELH